MIDSYSINGPALVYIGDAGAENLQLLGYTDSGVDLNVLCNKEPQFTDLYGPNTPQEIRDMGMAAQLIIPLIAYDYTLLQSILDFGDRLDDGGISTPGLPLGQLGYAYSVAIAADPANALPWVFPYCATAPKFDVRLAVKLNPFRLNVIAWPWAAHTVQTAVNNVLWYRSIYELPEVVSINVDTSGMIMTFVLSQPCNLLTSLLTGLTVLTTAIDPVVLSPFSGDGTDEFVFTINAPAVKMGALLSCSFNNPIATPLVGLISGNPMSGFINFSITNNSTVP